MTADRTVWKFNIPIADDQKLTAPGLSGIVHAADAGTRQLHLWADVDPTQPEATMTVHIRGTGHQSPDPWTTRHVATVIAGPLVWHVYQGAHRG